MLTGWINRSLTTVCILQTAASSLQPFKCLKNLPCDPAYPEMCKKWNSGNDFSIVGLTHYKATLISFPFGDGLLLFGPNQKARLGVSWETQVAWSSDVPWLGLQSLPKANKKPDLFLKRRAVQSLIYHINSPHRKQYELSIFFYNNLCLFMYQDPVDTHKHHIVLAHRTL